ncbi:phosphoglycolate phosphatase 2 [Luminiphilus syltensis NOR5-1B]|uniref:Phosphoglycolate phosphatase 2 n=1 Tax=Luminiphilus syltensis NOR5-1B TaxID=565045 RepID=B8KQJ5_9GAMM|nr:HAD-IA family hydrolase [Luminiphilus syltensis]EED35905.1 phosphoglycolate phosphatase 2 [Luminiphilus syltensis NOR5-1B]
MKLPARLQGVVFDLDGTLVDTADDFIALVGAIRKEQGLPPLDDDTVRRRVSDGSPVLAAMAFDIDAGHSRYEHCREEFLDRYAQSLGLAAKPYPGLCELVATLGKSGIPWGVATNKYRRFAEPLMAMMPFEPAAHALVTPGDVTRSKPDPEPLLLSCKLLGTPPSGTLYVGDHRRDIDAGKNAGCPTIAAAYGYINSGDNPHDWGADAVVESSEALARMIEDLIA